MDSGTTGHSTGIWRMVFVFLLRFLAVSIPLYLVYTLIGSLYTRLVAYSAKPFLSLYGIELTIDRALSVTEEISLNPVVFLSLVIAVQKIEWLKKLKAAALGIVILTVSNIVVVFFLFMSADRQSEALWTGTEFLNLTINFFLPLLLLFLLLPLRSVPNAGGETKDAPPDPESVL
ncbi:MAG: hypothetical protein KAX13_09180 [Candidatus Krumholzibacteria bacterium]|nr:hypothetical protein [Candidatus Krumholzibacteria bacterium]